MRDAGGEVVVVRDEDDAVADRAETRDDRRKPDARVAVLADRRLVEHDPRHRAGKRPQPAQALARGERRQQFIGWRHDRAVLRERPAPARDVFAERRAAPLVIRVLGGEREYAIVVAHPVPLCVLWCLEDIADSLIRFRVTSSGTREPLAPPLPACGERSDSERSAAQRRNPGEGGVVDPMGRWVVRG
jgi:hypothetical protein